MFTCCPGIVELDTVPYLMSGAGHLTAVERWEIESVI